MAFSEILEEDFFRQSLSWRPVMEARLYFYSLLVWITVCWICLLFVGFLLETGSHTSQVVLELDIYLRMEL